jgi:aspartyl-tRNA synthetase
VSAEDVQEVVERVLVELWDQGGQPVASPFPRLTWAESMERFGIDKPDLRYEKEMQIHDFTTDVAEDSADFVRQAVASGGRLRGIVVPGGGAKFSRKDIDNLGVIAKGAKAGGLIWIKRVAAGWEGQGMKAIGASALGFSSSISKAAWADQSMLLAVVGSDEVTSPALHGIRSAAIARMGLAPSIEHAFCWIVDFPLFERDAETGQYTFAHHPFTAPHPADAGRLESDPGHCRAQHYDAVYNGMELGSGSIRITDPAIQQTVFRLLGISEPEIRRRFGFLLDGLAAGAPPHGGFAIGFDRVAMLLAGGSSLRDVIAFPKTTAARALFEGAPTAVKQEDLKALHLKVE